MITHVSQPSADTTLDTVDVAIIGAGIVGLGHAYAALRRGLSVAIIERADSLTGASIRNFGHAGVAAQDAVAREYALASRVLWLQLAEEAGFWARESGCHVVARSGLELAVLRDFAATRSDEVSILSAQDICAALPVSPVDVRGGAFFSQDLQVNPREAGPAIARYLERIGASIHWRTSALSVKTGLIETSRGRVCAGEIIVATNHDIDQLYPEIAESREIVRCGLDMMRVAPPAPIVLPGPVLTGWSLLRYEGFAASPSLDQLRALLTAQEPDLVSLDINQMYTQLPDGSILVGDTHYRGVGVPPFQSEGSFAQLERITRDFFGWETFDVLERWQGVYASSPTSYVNLSPETGVTIATVTTGIGMSTGLGLAESNIASLFGELNNHQHDPLTVKEIV